MSQLYNIRVFSVLFVPELLVKALNKIKNQESLSNITSSSLLSHFHPHHCSFLSSSNLFFLFQLYQLFSQMALHGILHGPDGSNLPHSCHMKYPNQKQRQASRSFWNSISFGRGEQRTLTSTETSRIHCIIPPLFHVYINKHKISANISIISVLICEDQDRILKQAGKNNPKIGSFCRVLGGLWEQGAGVTLPRKVWECSSGWDTISA